MRITKNYRWLCGIVLLALSGAASGQLTENCVVSVLNRTVQVKPDGTWVLPNIPANFGSVRARATCVENGVTTAGESALFTIPANGSVDVPPINLGPATSIPSSATLSATSTTLTQPNQTTQLTVTARYADGTTGDITSSSTGTQYLISNPVLASVSADGLVTAKGSGTALIQAVNEGSQGLLLLSIALSQDSDGDGIPDDVELRLGLDPNNPADALDDLDRDGLSNKDELQFGTDMRNADSDGDGILDGEEVIAGLDGFITNPLLADTDGDGVPDNVEVDSGSDPTDPTSTNLPSALKRITVNPTNFVINVNTVDPLAFQQLTVTGEFKLGGSIDLTSLARGTNYASSNLQVCNFGAQAGRVFGGSDGSCVITVTNSGFAATATGTVRTFTPKAISQVAIPGYANNVDASGNYAYVAAGSTGLQVVSVSNPASPEIVGSADTPGNANDVRLVGNLAFVADGSFGLRIFDVGDPTNPTLVGAVDTAGDAMDVMVVGGRAYVADGINGVAVIDVNTATAPSLVKQLDTPGTARGIDVLAGGNGNVYALVTDDSPSTGLRVIDATDPANAAIVANLSLPGSPKDLRVNGNFAYVAAFTGGMRIIDLSNPLLPVAAGSLPTQFVPRDVEVAGNFAIFAEQLFPNAVPLVEISDPLNPIFRTTVDFSALGDYAGTGIAVNGPYFYMTGERFIVSTDNGVIGDTRLFVGQYLPPEDRNGIPPQISLTEPTDGSTAIQGSMIPLRADATDDVAVASVTFTVNGVDIFTDTAAPYETLYAVPGNATSLTIVGTAIDLGNNLTSSPAVNVTAIPDPLTTVIGRVVDRNGTPLAGADVTCLGINVMTIADGSFSIPGLSTIQGDIRCTASFNNGTQTLSGVSNAVPPVRGASTDVGQIVVQEVFSRGRDFWLAHQAVLSPGAQVIILSDVVANFTVSATGFSFTGSASAQSPAVVPIPDTLQIRSNQVVENKGIHITSDVDVTALLFFSGGGATDIALAIPTQGLGTEYIAVGWQESVSARGFPNLGFSEFAIVSNQNNTNVTIVPSCMSRSGTAVGPNLNIVLNQGEAYQYQCSNRGDVTGSLITSDKPIGVISGNLCADVPLGVAFCDVLSEMMFSVATLYGTEFYSAPLPGNAADIFRIMAAKDGTVITVDQGAAQNTYFLDRGQFQELNINPATHFTSNQPISVTQYAVGIQRAGIGDPFQMQLVPTSAYRDTFRLYTPGGFNQGTHTVIIAPNAAVPSVTLNGVLVAGFQPLPGGSHQYVVVPVPVGQSVISAAQPIAVNGIGFGNFISYGYPVGF